MSESEYSVIKSDVIKRFHCKQLHSNFKSTFCMQTVQNLIKHCILQHLIRFCTVWGCTIKRRFHFNIRINMMNNSIGQLPVVCAKCGDGKANSETLSTDTLISSQIFAGII